MTEASTTVPGDIGRIECLDRQGNEVFPADSIAAACELAVLLEPEFELDDEGAVLIENVSVAAQNIGVSYNRAKRLARPEDRFWLKIQQAVRRNVTRELCEAGPHPRDYFLPGKLAVHKLAPEEIAYFATAIVEERRDVTDDDFVIASQFNQPSLAARMARKVPRLQENTPENLVELDKVGVALTHLVLVDNQYMAVKALDIPLAFGDRGQVAAAASLLRRLKNIAMDQESSPVEKMRAQGRANVEIGRLVRGINLDQLDEETAQCIHAQIYTMHTSFTANFQGAKVIRAMAYGRAYRLNGNRHIESIEEFEGSQNGNGAQSAERQAEVVAKAVSPLQPENAKSEEPKPDFLTLYKGKLHEMAAAAVHFPKFSLMPTREIKRRLLEEAREVLVKGETDMHGNQVVNGRSKVETHRYISSIEFLRSFIPKSGDLGAAKERLEQAVSDSADHVGRLETLLGEAESRLGHKMISDLRSCVPEIHKIGDLVELVKSDWETASHVIKKYWPNGKHAAEQLGQLLFMSKEEIQAHQDEPAELLPDQVVSISRK